MMSPPATWLTSVQLYSVPAAFICRQDARTLPGRRFCIPAERSYVHVGAPPFSLDWWNRGWSIEIIAVIQSACSSLRS
jgi:hypothetical protein